MADEKARQRVSWTATARADLEAIINYIADDSVDRALAVMERLEGAAGKLAALPRRA